MDDADRGQVTAAAAEVYDSFFVPALFAQWPSVVLDAAEVTTGHSVLDIGCGTGVLTQAAKARVGPAGQIAAIDPNEGMLEVACRTRPDIEWMPAIAEELPFDDDRFDRAVSQFALMFFTDPSRALVEIARVTKPGGRIALAVWHSLENNVGYARLAGLLERLFGQTAAQAIRAPFHLGTASGLTNLAEKAIADAQITSHRGTARFESLEAWLHTEIRGWTLADEIDDDQFMALIDTATRDLADLEGAAGHIAFDVSALILSGAPSAR
jgi:ubiquinone/menaquinone biosynthesis C-methylase UbiE